MGSFANSDVIGVPGTGLSAHINTVVCGAPKGATNQYKNVSYYGDSHIQPTGGLPVLVTRLHIPSVVLAISG